MSVLLATAFRLMSKTLQQSFQGTTTRTMATKKAGGSTTNGRDSAGRRLGIKLHNGVFAKAGAIIVRQRGMTFRVGEGVGVGRDHTIFAKQSGVVKFTKYEFNKKRIVVHVTPEPAKECM